MLAAPCVCPVALFSQVRWRLAFLLLGRTLHVVPTCFAMPHRALAAASCARRSCGTASVLVRLLDCLSALKCGCVAPC